MFLPSATGKISIPQINKVDDLGVSGFEDLMTSDGIVFEPAEMEEELEVLVYYFGKEFLNNNLEFKLNPKINGKNVYGYVEDLRTIIGYNQFKKVMRGVSRHEGVHYALRHFVDPKSFKAIIEATKRQMEFQEGIKREISDREASEFLAEVNRGAKNLKKHEGLSGILKQFVDWVAGLFKRSVYGTQAVKFLSMLNRGDFRNAEAIYRNVQGVDTMSMDEEGVAPEEILFAYEQGTVSALEMENIFGSREAVLRAMGHIIRNAFVLSPYNKNLMAEDEMRISEINSFEDALDQLYTYQGEKHLSTPSRVFPGDSLYSAYGGIRNISQLPVIQREGLSDEEIRNLRKVMIQEWMGYRIYTDKDLYDSLVKAAYPNYRPSEEEHAYIQKRFWDNKDERDAFTSMSSVLKMYISTIPLNTYKLENGIIRMTVSEGVRYLNPRDMDNLLKKVGVFSASSRSFSGTTSSILFKNLADYAKEQLTINPEGTKETNYIYSLLDNFVFVGLDGTFNEKDRATNLS